MSEVTVHEVLVDTGMEQQASCLNLHSSQWADGFSVAGNGYNVLTMWDPPAVGPSGASFSRYPLKPPVGGFIQSHPRCFYLQFHPPFGAIADARFWLTPFTEPTGWTFEIGVSETRTSCVWRPAADFMADPLSLGRLPNLMGGYRTEPGDFATWEPTLSLDATGTTDGVSTYDTALVFARATVTDAAASGPPLGYDGAGLALPLQWNFGWDEL